MLNTKEVIIELNKILDINKIGSVVISNPIKKDKDIANKVKVSSIMLKDKPVYQLSIYIDDKVIHRNIEPIFIIDEVIKYMEDNFKQCNIISAKNCSILMNKKRLFTITSVKDNADFKDIIKEHNHKKNYILGDGQFIEWMYKLNLMDKTGKVHNSMQKKFRQINKFLEMLKDVESEIPQDSIIIDMGCGKSYLTFAMYHYFNIIKNKNITIKGYDLKKDVVDYCNSLADEFDFKLLSFYNEDIANIENTDNKISMIITLHACDTATDYAIYHGIRWGCNVMMNVPCCQHEIYKQIKNEDMNIMLNHGIIKERFAALLTDSIRASIIEIKGYKASVMEFIDMEHTPKNIMIRSVKTKKGEDTKKLEELKQLINAYNITPTLYKLFWH